MRVAVCASLVLLACCTLASAGRSKKKVPKVEVPKVEVPKVNEIRVNTDYLEKSWGLNSKSYKVDASPSFSDITLVLEFTKDVPNLSEIRQALGIGAKDRDTALVWLYIFDEENVVVGKTKDYRVYGELTGVKGDAIRVRFYTNPIRNKFKVEARPDKRLKESGKDKQ
jgi:hypothetical protein